MKRPDSAASHDASFDSTRRSRLPRGVAGTLPLEQSATVALAPTAVTGRARRPGDVLNERYLVLDVAGQGGMGLVYRVRDALNPERAVALKTVSPSFVDASRVHLLPVEFLTMSELSHPNIARVYDFERIAGSEEHMFTMELLDGQDLFRATEGRPIPEVVDAVVEACRALRYLHGRGVVHADFKPKNAMLTSAGEVKVLDFGLSGLSGAGMFVGTPAYMAPELGEGHGADVRSDLYALGISLYELVFRRLPFIARSAEGMFNQHLRSPLPRDDASGDTVALFRVLERLCAKRRDDRPASADEVIELLGAVTGRAYPLETVETQRSYVSTAKHVGRAAEEQALLDYCLRRTSLAGPVDDVVLASVSGASGIGKSRLVAEAKRRLQLRGVPFVETDCYDAGLGDFEPVRDWIEALRRIGRAHGKGDRERPYEAALDALSSRTPPAAATPADHETARMTWLRGLADYVVDLAEDVGFVLSMGDLQWARTSTTDFLRLLCDKQLARSDGGRRARLAVVVTYRDDEAWAPLDELLGAVDPENWLSLALAPLPPERTTELVASMLGRDRAPDVLAARVAVETGGNPFFIQEVMRTLMERGSVYSEGERWDTEAAIARIEVPPTVAAALDRRLASVDAAARDLLDWVSVYGHPMPLRSLAEVAGRSVDDVQRILDGLAARHMVVSAAGAASTAHDKLREHLYAEMDPSARRERHAVLSQLLDRIAAGRLEFVVERAHHAWHGGDEEGARLWTEQAAVVAERGLAMDVAIDNLDRARQLADRRGDGEARRRLADRMLELCASSGQYARLLAAAEVELAHRDDRLERARLRQLEGEALCALGRLPEAIERLREATALLGMTVPRSSRLRRAFIGAHYVRHLVSTAARASPFARAPRLSLREQRRRELLGMCCLLMAIASVLGEDDQGYALVFAGINAVLPLRDVEVLPKLLANGALVDQSLGRSRTARRLMRMAERATRTESERAIVMCIKLLARQLIQRPFSPEDKPVYAYEGEVVRAIELLSTRSRTLHANVARMVATTIVCKYARRYERRPEVARWAEAMRGTLHYGFVESHVAAFAKMGGDGRRAEKAYALASAASTPTKYRAWASADYAYVCAVVGETGRSERCVQAVLELLPRMPLRDVLSLWVPAMTVAACVVMGARSTSPSWLRSALERLVSLLDGRPRRPPDMRLFHEAGRAALGRSSRGALARAVQEARATWIREQAMIGYIDGCLLASLAMRSSTRIDERRAAAAWGREALAAVEERFPAAYAAHVRRLVEGPSGA